MNKAVITIISSLMLCGCVIAPPRSNLFDEKQIETSHFSIAVWEKKDIQKGKTLRIYFEGDGNPNPKHTVAFDFAAEDPSPNVIYIARPCQWIDNKICKNKPEVYQSARFHPEIMQEMQELTEYITRKHQAPKVEFVGYDGGAVIALNMATRMPTERVITIAGITDIDTYNDLHDIPIASEEDQENPASKLAALSEIPQIHYVGQNDNITPRRLVERFVARMKNPKSAVVKLVPDTNHTNWKGVKLDYK